MRSSGRGVQWRHRQHLNRQSLSAGDHRPQSSSFALPPFSFLSRMQMFPPLSWPPTPPAVIVGGGGRVGVEGGRVGVEGINSNHGRLALAVDLSSRPEEAFSRRGRQQTSLKPASLFYFSLGGQYLPIS